MGGQSCEGLDGQFEDSLGDFEEAIAGGAGGSGGDEEIDILDPMGGGSGAQGDEPLFEEGDLSGEGGMENQTVAQRAASGAPSEGSSSSGGGGQQSGSPGGGEQGEGCSDEASESGSEAGAGGAGSGAGGGAKESNRNVGGIAGGSEPTEGEIVAVPEDIGDGRSDDIVLRQIREAAMNEKDPVLREKLWDEYRRISGER
jgi:hypothetical protein